MKPNIWDIIIACLLISVSYLLGWWSTIGIEDVISKISVNIVSILLPLLVLHTTLVIQLLNEIRRYKEGCESANFNRVIRAIKCNFIAESVILFIAVLVLICNAFLQTLCTTNCALLNWIIANSQVLANGFVIFAILYFMWIIMDEIGGFLKLFVENSRK